MVNEQVAILLLPSFAVNVITVVPAGKLADTDCAAFDKDNGVEGSHTAPRVKVNEAPQLSAHNGLAIERNATQEKGSELMVMVAVLQV